MKIICFFIILPIIFFSCKDARQTGTKEIIIEGQVKNVPDGKIYFVESRKWKTPLDSTEILNGHFSFKINTDTGFIPFLAAIHYWNDSTVIRLKYRNHTLGADSLKYSTDAFYIEPGMTKIEGDNKNPPYLRIFSGRENELLFKNQFIDFGWLENLDAAQRLSKIAEYKKVIKENPFSYFLLESIYRSKEQYPKKDLQEIFSLFNNSVQFSEPGKLFSNYLTIRPDDGKPLPDLSLLTPDDSRSAIFDPSAKIHMLVFWASWCLPCRKEVPLLKEIQKKYSDRGLKMVSISIDQNKDSWKKALAIDKTGWLQLHVPAGQIDMVQHQFSFTTIPLIIFTDNTGREIARIANYEPENTGLYETVILKYIK